MSVLLGIFFYVVLGYFVVRALPAVRSDVARLRRAKVVRVKDGGL